MEATTFNEMTMPYQWGLSQKNFRFGDFIGVHEVDNGAKYLVPAQNMTSKALVTQIVGMEKFGGRTVLETTLGSLSLNGNNEGMLCKIDMSRHILSPPAILAIAHNLMEYEPRA